ncbi:hypothetical protein NK356_18440 [Chryseobacterium sp. S0630]|uniref:hypothetical protein n=1 Tax=Chryseobacterium sp. S0630 TaxID=2957803 RepID=UPI000553FF56|nr:hypothetical protein [Chryseobacterium sp. S0630]MCP1301161.1 hypothetical protein [Chryseobacterium sp. S0630]
MKKSLIAALISGLAYSQVGINTTAPATTLDVKAKLGTADADGLQAPRLTRAELTGKGTLYTATQTGALVYITDITGGDTAGPRANITSIGYYYFDGIVWQRVITSTSVPNDYWKLTGNSGTAAGTNFIGTTDNVDLITKTNNIEAMRTTSTQQVLIGTNTVPAGGGNSKLIIDNGTTAGGLQLKDGTQGNNKVLMSDNNGVASWRNNPVRAYISPEWNAGPGLTGPAILQDLKPGALFTVSLGQAYWGNTGEIFTMTASLNSQGQPVLYVITTSSEGPTATVTNNLTDTVTVTTSDYAGVGGSVDYKFKVIESPAGSGILAIHYENNNPGHVYYMKITGFSPTE